jgi:hypothetical protein
MILAFIEDGVTAGGCLIFGSSFYNSRQKNQQQVIQSRRFQ